MVEREVWEESGFEVAARPSSETLAVGFFAFDGLPPLPIERTHPRHLAEVLAHLQDRGRPTAFD
jgi:hypothetical protein